MRTTTRLGVAGVLALGAGLWQCSDGSFQPSDCPSMSISITPGTAPRFNWTSACSAIRVWVQDVASTEILWDIAADNGIINPPVTYGTVPSGAHRASGPVPSPNLVAGTQYRVAVIVHVETFAGRDYTVERTFSP